MLDAVVDFVFDHMGKLFVLLLAFFAWVVWQDAHDGQRCVEQRVVSYVGHKVGSTIVMQPIHECVRYVPDSTS
jgi:hypothetical protein